MDATKAPVADADRAELIQEALVAKGLPPAEHFLMSDDQNCRTNCLSGECHPAARCCLMGYYTIAQTGGTRIGRALREQSGMSTPSRVALWIHGAAVSSTPNRSDSRMGWSHSGQWPPRPNARQNS